MAVLCAALFAALIAAAPAGTALAAQTDPTPTPPPSPTDSPPPEPLLAPGPMATDPALGGSSTAATPEAGVGGLLRGPDNLRDADDPTNYERFGTGAYTVRAELGLTDVTDKALNGIAGVIFGITVWMAHLVIVVFQWAFTFQVFDSVGQVVAGLTRALGATFYLPWLTALLVLAGLYVLWHGVVRRRGTMAGEGALWAVLALIVGLALLNRPEAVVNGASNLSTGLSRGILAGVAGADPSSNARDPDTQLRVSADRLWNVYVHTPWKVLQFGALDVGDRFAERLLAANTYSPSEVERLRSGEAAAADMEADKQRQYEAVTTELRESYPDAYAWFQGKRSVERVGVASLALAATSVGGLLLLLVAGAVLLAELALVLLVVLAPLFLLAGIQPGPGRVVALRWVELCVGLLVKRLVLSALLAVILVLSGLLLSAATSQGGWGLAAILHIGLVAAVIVYRKPFTSLFAHVGMPHLSNAAANRASDARREHRGPVQTVGRTAAKAALSKSGAAVIGAVAGVAAGRASANDDDDEAAAATANGSGRLVPREPVSGATAAAPASAREAPAPVDGNGQTVAGGAAGNGNGSRPRRTLPTYNTTAPAESSSDFERRLEELRRARRQAVADRGGSDQG